MVLIRSAMKKLELTLATRTLEGVLAEHVTTR